MNEIVKYDNYMNNLNFKGFTATDYNFLMTLCSKMRDKDTTQIEITFEELREKTGYTQCATKQFVADLKRMNEKLMKITCCLETEDEILMFVLFPTFCINISKQILIVSVNEKFKFILNELIKNFTRFDLKEFVELESKYSKSLYRLLKQYKTTGKYEVGINDFREKMSIPKSCPNYDIKPKIIDPAIKELSDAFIGLKVTIQHARKRGKPVTGYLFTFTPEVVPKAAEQSYSSKSDAAKKSAVLSHQSSPRQPYKNRWNSFEQHYYTSEEIKEHERIMLQKTIDSLDD